jgi:hypothetical protein
VVALGRMHVQSQIGQRSSVGSGAGAAGGEAIGGECGGSVPPFPSASVMAITFWQSNRSDGGRAGSGGPAERQIWWTTGGIRRRGTSGIRTGSGSHLQILRI